MGAFLRVPENELLTQRVSKSGMTVLYRNPDFSAYDTADAMGLTSESIEQSGGQSPEKYGVMLISLDPDILQQQAAEKIGSTLRYMSEEDTMLWIAEEGNGTILAASDNALTGKDIFSVGMGENDTVDRDRMPAGRRR